MPRPADIDPFDRYVERGNVVERGGDPSTAGSLFNRAQRKFRNMERLGITEETVTDYFENVYEAVKMLVQAFMALDGYNPYSHEAIIAYAIDHLDLDLEKATRFNKYRRLRNDVAYRGDAAKVHEATEIRQLFLDLLDDLESEFESRLS